jgi:hypothetical protein
VSETDYLYTQEGAKVNDITNAVYYSFITATSTGYGDIVPRGMIIRTMAISEVIIGLLMLALVTSKMVSIKQEKLLEQLFQLSFSEKMTRIVSSFNLFCNEIDNLLYSLESEEVDRKKMFTLSLLVTSLHNNVMDIHKIFFNVHKGHGKLAAKLDNHQIEHLLVGMSHSFGKLNKVLDIAMGNEVLMKKEALVEKIYGMSNEAEEIVFEVKRSDPIYTQKSDEVLMILRTIRANVLSLKITSHKNKEEKGNIYIPDKIVVQQD